MVGKLLMPLLHWRAVLSRCGPAAPAVASAFIQRVDDLLGATLFHVDHMGDSGQAWLVPIPHKATASAAGSSSLAAKKIRVAPDATDDHGCDSEVDTATKAGSNIPYQRAFFTVLAGIHEMADRELAAHVCEVRFH